MAPTVSTLLPLLLLIVAPSVHPQPIAQRPSSNVGRTAELAWQAWLLVDQPGRLTPDVGAATMGAVLRRRITPKSVFIAPTFSPEALPACAEGYTSDAMGRCVNIFKIDESAHLKFLLDRLNAQFGDYEDADEEEVSNSAPGPLQLNIPLLENVEENETDYAIVVTPAPYSKTAINTESSPATSTSNAKRKEHQHFDVESVAAILGVRPEDVEVTTLASTQTPTITTPMDVSTMESTLPSTVTITTETSTLPVSTTTEEVPTSTVTPTTTMDSTTTTFLS